MQLFLPSEKWGPQDRSIPYDPMHGVLGQVESFELDKPPMAYDQKVTDHIPDPYAGSEKNNSNGNNVA